MAQQVEGPSVGPARGRVAPPGGIKLVVMHGDAVDPDQKRPGRIAGLPSMVLPPTHRNSLERIGRRSHPSIYPAIPGGEHRSATLRAREFLPVARLGVLNARASAAQHESGQSKCWRSCSEPSLQWGPQWTTCDPLRSVT
jgi:hypothetical protein